MKPKIAALLTGLSFIASVASTQAQVVYENLGTPAIAGYSELNSNNPIFGDTLTLTSGGTLASLGLSLFNSTSGGNTGSIIAGTTVVNFYDNTTAYVGGAITGSLLGTASLNWDFTGSPLSAGFYSTDVFDLSSLNIVLPQNILITQQFTQTSGTSLRNGFILFNNPTVGSSPNTVYLKSNATAEGLYTFTGNPGQVGFEVTLVPEPGAMVLASLGAAALLIFRRRR